MHYKWRNVALLTDSGDWGKEAGNAFERSFKKYDPGARVITPPDKRVHDRTACTSDVKDANGYTVAETLLMQLEREEARIVVVMTHPRCVRHMLAASYRTQRMYSTPGKPGVAWMIAWVSDELFRDTVTGEVDMDAVRGANGLLAAEPVTIDTSSEVYKDYWTRWKAASPRHGRLFRGEILPVVRALLHRLRPPLRGRHPAVCIRDRGALVDTRPAELD